MWRSLSNAQPALGLGAFAVLGVLLFSGVGRSGAPEPGSLPATRIGVPWAHAGSAVDRIRSVTFSARRPPSDSTLARLGDLGLTHLTLVPFAFQRGIAATEIRFNPDARWYTESDAGIRSLAATAHEMGMRVIIKPHVWVGRRNGEDEWRSNIGFETDEEWATWEAGYRSFILHHARLAAEVDADILVIGTELMRPAVEREQFWRGLIADVRDLFPGRVTYAANWWREYNEIGFWDSLDFVGVQAYFPVGSADDPSLRELGEGWKPHMKEMQTLARRVKRPVLFTEIGYRSYRGAPERPWEWPTREQARAAAPDYQVQANLYEAFFRSLWNEKWFAGAILWRWYADEESDGETQQIGFTPQNKPAEAVIRKWFGESDKARR